MALISVVISTYNRSDLLRWALGSATAQRDVDFEVIVVDNGSSDDTQARLAGLSDPRIRVIRNATTLGGIGGRNTGISASRGEWLAILDDDDLWAPDKLAVQLAIAEAAQRDWVYAGAVYINSTNSVVHGRRAISPEQAAAKLPIDWCLPGGISNVMWRKGMLDGDGLLDPRLTFTADWDIALRLLREGPPAAVQRPLVAYRQHGANASHLARKQQDQMEVMGDKFADLRGGRSIPVGPRYRFIASQALLRGDYKEAAKAYAMAVRHGDLPALVRAPAILIPQALHPLLRRSLLSETDWIHESEGWIRELQPMW